MKTVNMSSNHKTRAYWLFVIILSFWSLLADAQQFHYQYVSLKDVKLPSGYSTFIPAAILDSGRVYGNVCADELCSDPKVVRVAFYEDGVVTATQASGQVTTANENGLVGGNVFDTQNAALFRGNTTEIIPPGQVNEFFAWVIGLNRHNVALVESDDPYGNPVYVIYNKGKVLPIDFGNSIHNPIFLGSFSRTLNNSGIIAGTQSNTGNRFVDGRGFRFDFRAGKAQILAPVFPDTLSWGLGVNNNGDVLGYSFVNTTPYHERVGIWDRNGRFHTYYDETISSSNLVFNDNNLIVISQTRGNNSYLIPKPGVRLNLASLVDNLPSGQDLYYINNMNNVGDMVGTGSNGNNFLLKRINKNES